MTINCKKTVEVIFSKINRRNHDTTPPIIPNGENFEPKLYVKYLGDFIDNHLKFTEHVQYLNEKLNKFISSLYCLRKLVTFL